MSDCVVEGGAAKIYVEALAAEDDASDDEMRLRQCL